MTLPASSTPEQHEGCRLAFYSGAYAVLMQIIGVRKSEGEPAAIQRLFDLHREGHEAIVAQIKSRLDEMPPGDARADAERRLEETRVVLDKIQATRPKP